MSVARFAETHSKGCRDQARLNVVCRSVVEMTSRRIFFSSAVVGAALMVVLSISLPAPAAFFDEECLGSCGDAVKACVQVGRTAFKGCREECRDSEDRRACSRACRPALQEQKTACKTARNDCKQSCAEQPLPPEECEHCRAELRVCLYELNAAGRTCGSACLDAKVAAMKACRQGPEPTACLVRAARETAACLGGCAQTMRSGMQGCQVGHERCRRQCEGGGPGPYGSASQAFLVDSDSLF